MGKELTGPLRQKKIYIDGAGGSLPKLPLKFHELRRSAQEVMSRDGFDYVAGGAGTENTMTTNRSAFEEWRILPRMLRDVSQRNTSLTLLGRTIPAPFFTCPIGVLELAHRRADLAVADACSSLGIPMIFSNQASFPMEECADRMGDGPRWFQLYWSQSDELVKSLVSRAETCGCNAIVVTLDTTMLGWRNRDLQQAHLPFLKGKGIAQYTSDPVFQDLVQRPDENEEPPPPLNLKRLLGFLELCARHPGNFWSNFRSQLPVKSVRKFIQIYSRPNLTWDDLEFLRSITKLPIVLKGILDPEDARRALDHGVDAIYVSNHGGRQVDGAVGAAQVLPMVVEAVNDAVPVLYDSGIRSGSDLFKALALGATAVGIGRPYVYGLALAGADGVREVLENIWAEFDLTMGLSGCAELDEICMERLLLV